MSLRFYIVGLFILIGNCRLYSYVCYLFFRGERWALFYLPFFSSLIISYIIYYSINLWLFRFYITFSLYPFFLTQRIVNKFKYFINVSISDITFIHFKQLVNNHLKAVLFFSLSSIRIAL